MSSTDVAQVEADHEARWRIAIRRELYRWHTGLACGVCGEWIGHFGGDFNRPRCTCIPTDVPLEEVRPNCYTVRRYWIGDAIRAALAKVGSET